MKQIRAYISVQRLVSGEWLNTPYTVEVSAPSEVLPVLALNAGDSLLQLTLADVSLLPHSGLRITQFYMDATEGKDSK